MDVYWDIILAASLFLKYYGILFCARGSLASQYLHRSKTYIGMYIQECFHLIITLTVYTF